MKKTLCFFAVLLMSAMAIGQSIVVTFTGRNQNGNYHPFTSVSVQNQTRGWSQTLTYPDTTLILNVTQGIADVDRQMIGLSAVAPNPFVGTATATLALAEAEHVTFEVVRINGQRIVAKDLDLPAGSHQIALSLAETQVAFLVVKTPTQRYVAKLANKGNGGGNDIRLLGSTENIPQRKAVAEGDFQVGDLMSYVGLSGDGGTSTAVAKSQQASELISLVFTDEDQTTGLPTVITLDVSNITAYSATCGGNVTDDGNTTVTERGVCWSTSHNPTVSNSHTTDGSGIGSFTSSITGLSANTTYYVRAYATNSAGTAYGEERTFTTSASVSLPTVTTSSVSSITLSTATCGGNVTNDGNATVTARGVCWSTSHNPTVSNSHTTDGSGTGNFTSSITWLSANTTYYVRAYATNSVGTAYGNEVLFTTNTPSVVGFDENGASNAVFTVAYGCTVKFSRGNLQYQASTGTWRFAEHQSDFIGTDNTNISSSYSGWIDLFGWGTSGWVSGANAYQPWATSTTYSDYQSGSSGINYLTGDYANADWGVYNAISNGGNQAGMWRTLTSDEWSYLLNSRATSTINGVENARYAEAVVNGKNGLVIFPDNFTMPSGMSYPSGINTGSATFNSNIYTASQWSQMEGAGCIFLPAAGYRNGTGVSYVGSGGYYWASSSPYAGEYIADYVYFYSGVVSMNYLSRYYGLSVRLVRDY
jgi:hypothetical protein